MSDELDVILSLIHEMQSELMRLSGERDPIRELVVSKTIFEKLDCQLHKRAMTRGTKTSMDAAVKIEVQLTGGRAFIIRPATELSLVKE